MNPKTKKTTNLPRSKLGIAGAVFSLWAIAVYSAGLLNPLQASQDTTLKVNGVQNHVQYLTSLVITGVDGNVEFKYDQATNSVQALGALNMQNIVIEDKNARNTASNPSAVILGGTGNRNEGQSSVILGGTGNRNKGQSNLLVNTQNSTSESFNTAIIRGDAVTTNGKNIFVNNASSNEVNGENIFINGSSSSKVGNNVAIFGSKVNNTKSNVFIFNGNNAEFNPNLDSAFYANGKVAINGSNAVGTLHVHGGVMVQNRGKKYDIPDQSGTIALFSRDGKTGLCGYDGLRNRRVPLSESARLYGLCVEEIEVPFPKHAVSKYSKNTTFPQVWNQNENLWDWESPKWIYGHKEKPQRFICDKGYVPDTPDPIWKTGVSCTPCQGAEAGDLTCKTNKGDESAPPVLKCPDGYESSTNTEICIKKTKCIKNPNSEWVVGLTYDEQIEEYNMNTQTTSVTQKCDIKCDEAKGYKYVAWDPSSSDLNLRNAHCAKSKPLYRCLWEVEHGHLIEWDDEWLSQDTSSRLVQANTSAKCEYVCNDGYEFSRPIRTSRRGRVRETGLPICKRKKVRPLPKPPVNWSCDIANRWCTTGIKTARQDEPTAFTWTCAGKNWGTNASCKKEKDMCVGEHNFGPHAKLHELSTTWVKGKGNVKYTLNKGSGNACSYHCELGWQPNSTKTACEEQYVCIGYLTDGRAYRADAPAIVPATEKDCKAHKIQGRYLLMHRWPYNNAKSEVDRAKREREEEGYYLPGAENKIRDNVENHSRCPDWTYRLPWELCGDKEIR